jgi:hypothetical protein
MQCEINPVQIPEPGNVGIRHQWGGGGLTANFAFLTGGLRAHACALYSSPRWQEPDGHFILFSVVSRAPMSTLHYSVGCQGPRWALSYTAGWRGTRWEHLCYLAVCQGPRWEHCVIQRGVMSPDGNIMLFIGCQGQDRHVMLFSRVTRPRRSNYSSRGCQRNRWAHFFFSGVSGAHMGTLHYSAGCQGPRCTHYIIRQGVKGPDGTLYVNSVRGKGPDGYILFFSNVYGDPQRHFTFQLDFDFG